MTLGWTEDGPEAEALLSYSQSGDPNSPHFDDQTQLYAEKARALSATRLLISRKTRYQRGLSARQIKQKSLQKRAFHLPK